MSEKSMNGSAFYQRQRRSDPVKYRADRIRDAQNLLGREIEAGRMTEEEALEPVRTRAKGIIRKSHSTKEPQQ